MTVRDFLMLALILVVGLIFNRCAFEGEPAYRMDRGSTKIVVHNGRSLEDSLERLDQRMNELGDEMERRSEELEELMDRESKKLDEKMEKAGETLEEALQGEDASESTSAGSIAIVKSLQGDSPLHVVIPSACAETVVDWGSWKENQWRLSMDGDGNLEAPVLTVDKERGYTAIAFGERKPRSLELALPDRSFRLTIKDPDFIDAELLENELALRLGKLGEVKAVRENDNFTLTGEGWSVVLKGINIPVRVVDAVGRVLGEFNEDLEITLESGEAGGAQ